MLSIENQVGETVKELKDSLGPREKILEYEIASSTFKELVVKGLTKERGNQLLSSTDKASKVQVVFNAI